MPDAGIVGIAYVELRPLMTGFGAATEAELGSGGAAAKDLSLIGQDAGAALGTGIGTGADKALADYKVGTSGILGADGKPLASTLEAAGLVAGGSLGKGVGDGAAVELDKATATVASKGKTLSGLLSSIFGGAGTVIQRAGLGSGESFTKASDAIKQNASAIDKLEGAYAKLGKVSLIAGGAIGAGVVYESIKSANAFQQATYQISASADISRADAAKIGQAFLSTAGTAFASATEIGTAYAAVAGQLGATAGHALTATQALAFMNHALDLAEASGTDLSTSTAALSQVMQGFGLSLKQTGYASDVLFNASRLTNTSLTTVATSVDRLHGRLGAASPSLGDISSLMVEMAKNGISGGRSTQLVATAFTKLLGGSKAVSKELAALGGNGGAIAALQAKLVALSTTTTSSAKTIDPYTAKIAALRADVASIGTQPSGSAGSIELKNLKAQIAQLTAASDQWKAANKGATSSLSDQKKQIDAEITSLSKTQVSLFNAKGQFVGMNKAIAILHDSFRNLTKQQQFQAATTLFGAGSAQVMLRVIDQGPAAFEKWSKAISKSGSTAAAAKKNSHTLAREADVLKSSLEDAGIAIGLKLIPKITTLIGWLNKGVQWLEKNKGAASDLAHAIEVVLGGAITFFVATKIKSLITGVGQAVQALGKLAGASAATAGAEDAAGAGAFGVGAKALGAAGVTAAAAYGTHELLTKTAAGRSVASGLTNVLNTGVSDALNFFGAHTVAAGTNQGSTGTTTALTQSLIKKYGGLAGLEAASKHAGATATQLRKDYPTLADLRKYASTIHVHAGPGMNEQQLATAVSRKLATKVRS